MKVGSKPQAENRLVRNQLSALILFEQISTTVKRAKQLKGEMEILLHKVSACKDRVNLARLLKSRLYGGARIKMLDNPQRFKSVSLFHLKTRMGDGALMAKVVANPSEEKTTQKPTKEQSKKK